MTKTCIDFDPGQQNCCVKCHVDAQDEVMDLMYFGDWYVCCTVYRELNNV